MDSVGKGRGFPDQLMIREGKENSAELLQDKEWFVRFCDQVIYMFFSSIDYLKIHICF